MKDFRDLYKSEKNKNKNTKLPEEQIINKAIQFHLQGNIKEAKKRYEKLVRQGCNDHRVLSNYGVILVGLGNTKYSEKLFRKATELKPDYADAHNNLGNLLRDLNHLKEAEISMRKASTINPENANYQYNLGILLHDLDNYKEAEISFRKTIAINQNYVDAHYSLGRLLKDLGKFKEAEISFRKTIAIDQNYSKAYFALSLLIIDVENDNFLEYLFSKEILESKENKSKSNQADIFFARGNILERKENYKESYKMFRMANLITRKEFKSNFKIFKELLEEDNAITKEIEEISNTEGKEKDLPSPIFTVGLPRAGKSTIESILSQNNLLRNFGDRKGISEVVRDYRKIAESCETLGISINSTFKEIRTTYLRLAQQYHPDKGGDQELMAKIAEGYNFLKNEYKDKVKNYRRPSLFKFFIQKLNEDLGPFAFTSHTSPNNILYTGLIASQIPKAKIIYCYRNPKDHIVELYKYNIKNYLTLKTSIIDLAKIMVMIDNQLEEYKSRFHSKIYFLNFDELIREPKREIKSILNWLNWKYDDNYLTPKLVSKGIIESNNDFNSFNSAYLNKSRNYDEMLKPVEGILSKLTSGNRNKT